MKLWGGRFKKDSDKLAQEFNASFPFDIRLHDEDITASIVWARGLVGAGVLKPQEEEEIAAGLEAVRYEFQQGIFESQPDDEDIHTAVERRLVEIVGPVGGKLHTGRSRNDQVVTDFRLWTMRAIDYLIEQVVELQKAILNNSKENLDHPMPGYTHLQHAQPVTWGHWLMSHFWPLVRDVERLKRVRSGASVLPLGSAALAGTGFKIDRQALAAELGFEALSQNSLDAVSDRDFVADFLYAVMMINLHLSRLAEQLIIFNSAEFGFVTLDDAYSSGSSLMPQKKNPDALELTRGKSGRLIGNLTGLLVTLKGLPSAYDKDLQEDKEPAFDGFDTLALALPVMAGVIATLSLNPGRMAAQLETGLFATDLADYLVGKGVPFRQAHEFTGQAVQLSEDKGIGLTKLQLSELQNISPEFGEDVVKVFDIERSLAARSIIGGTGPEALLAQLRAAQAVVEG
ncbi:MAG: argininosuccinate lyase [Candidatus Promineifilaceae bacterium]